MSLKLQATIKGSDSKVSKIYWDTEWEEFRVKLIVDGKHQKKADYFCCDLEDAVGTARHMCSAQ